MWLLGLDFSFLLNNFNVAIKNNCNACDTNYSFLIDFLKKKRPFHAYMLFSLNINFISLDFRKTRACGKFF